MLDAVDAQIPQCTCSKPHNAPFYNRDVHIPVYKMFNLIAEAMHTEKAFFDQQ